MVSPFVGDSAMAERMRAVDWSRTALGPESDWPAGLRTAIGLLLPSRFPMFLGWGPDLRLFYNDAYRSILGAKDPVALGAPFAEIWADAWPVVAPMVRTVLDGTSTFSEDLPLIVRRRGFAEETYFTFSYSPIGDADERGLFCTVTETTRRVVGERRLRVLRELGETASVEIEGPAAACAAAVRVLGDHRADVAFVTAHVLEPDGRALRLVAAAGLPEHSRMAPALVGLPEGDPVGGPDPGDGAQAHRTVLAQVATTGRLAVVAGPAQRHRGAVLPGPGAADGTDTAADGTDTDTDTAVVLPLAPDVEDRPTAVLVIGVSPHLALDEEYRTFLDLVGQQVSKAITTAGAYEAQLRRNEQLAELDRAKTTFFSNISHEFRTPLTLMLGPLEQLRAEVADPAQRAELDLVHRNGVRLGRLVTALLDFARIEAGRVVAEFAPVDLAARTADLASVFRSAVERAGLALEVDCPDLGEPVLVDPDMWERVVLNLLSNAVKFTFDGSITVTLRREAGAAVLRVTDTGTGIPTGELPRLFERFHRVERAAARSAEGSGIGLALVRELVALHGGTITAESTVGVGTTFTVRVPLGSDHVAPERLRPPATGVADPAVAAEPFVVEALRWSAAAAPDQGGAAAPDGAAAPPPGGRPRVLVADDNADMREYLVRLLSGRYRVTAVGDGRAALDAVRAAPPDLLLADVMMPRTDGIELVAALRADPATSTLPVVLLSARVGQEPAAEGIAIGADDYLVKPFTAHDLLTRVDGQLRRAQVRNEAERRFRALADATPALIWVDGPGAQRVFVNHSWTAFTGAREADEDLGRAWWGRIHPDDRQRYAEVRATAEAGIAFDVEYRLRDHEGRYRWVLDRGAPVGEPGRSGGHVGGCLDVDSRHRERERERLLATLGAALDRGTTAQERREVLVRTLVAEGVVDMARFLEVDGSDEAPGVGGGRDGDGPRVGGRRLRARAVAARSAEDEEVLTRLDANRWRVEEVLAAGEPALASADDAYVAASSPDPQQRELRSRLAMGSVALVPLTTRGRPSGLLSVARSMSSPPLDETDLDLLREVGERAGTALDNALLLEREQATTRRLELLQGATAALSASATPLQVARTAVDQFAQLLGSRSVAVWELRETGTLEALDLGGWAAAAQRDWMSLPVDAGSPAGDAARLREPVWVEGTADWQEHYPRLLPMVREYGYTTIDCLPLLAGGRCLGVVAVGFEQQRVLTVGERAGAVALADQSAQALQRAGLLAAESGARRAAEEFAELVAALSGATTPQEVAQAGLRHATRAGAAAAVVVLRSSDRGEHLEVLAAVGPGSDEGRAVERRLPLDAAHPLAHAVRTGEPVWVGSRSAWAWRDRGFTPDTVLPAQVAVPLVVGGTAIGAIGMDFADTPVFSADQRSTLLTLAGQCAQALDRARLHQVEHEVADTLQRSLLPRELPALARLDTAARYLPGAVGVQAGGDWYEVLPVGGTRAALVVGDVVGQGAPAAAVMGQLRSALAGYLLDGHSPAAALERLDRFAGRIPGAIGSTCACLILDWDTGELCWARAGHLPVLLLEADGPRYLDDGDGTVLGVHGRPPYREAHGVIAPGTSVVLYTDGLVERRDELVDDGLARLARAAAGVRDRDPEALATGLLDAVLDDSAPADDVALVVVRLGPPPLRGRLPADPATLSGLRRAVQEWAATAALPEEMVGDLQFAFGEATANAVEHAYPTGGGEYGYVLTRTATGAVEARVRDWGRWRPVPGDSGHRGHGLRVIRTLGEEVTVDAGADGTEVRFRLPAPRRRAPAGRAAGALPPPGRSGGPPEGPGRRPAALEVVPGPGGTGDGDPGRVLRLTGDLDLVGVTAIGAAVLTDIGRPGAAVLDLRGAGYVSSAGVGLLGEVVAAARGSGAVPSVLVAPGSPAARILALTALDAVLPVAELPPDAPPVVPPVGAVPVRPPVQGSRSP